MLDPSADANTSGCRPLLTQVVTEDDTLRGLQRDFSGSDVRGALDAMRDLRVAVVGETIIDEYVYCDTLGKSGKDPVLSLHRRSRERQVGGALAVANHLAAFAKEVVVVSALGEHREHESFTRERLAPNVTAHFLSKHKAPTIVKQRFLDRYSLAKFFGVYDINEDPLCDSDDRAFCRMLGECLPGVDLVVVADYGHGLITRSAVSSLCDAQPFLCVNTQLNAANAGYHVVSRYPRADFVCVHEGELRLDARDKTSPLDTLTRRLSDRLDAQTVMVTLGKLGSRLYDRKQEVVTCPALADEVVERVGAGDAVLAVASLAMAQGVDRRLASLFGNLAGAQAVGVVGNQREVSRARLMRDALRVVTPKAASVAAKEARP